MGHTTVRISDAAHETLRELSQVEGKPMQALLDEAVEALRRRRFLEGVNTAYASLRGDARAWAAVEKERSEWDTALLDGLAVNGASEPYRTSKARARKKKT